ncbi:MAG: single-stranded-DNA-specific exonuclease RecJ [Bacteroidia bacterium]|nr:single-stranded-DNA-specific exonuclease RecJ [Bacteroidia bacterium]
MNFPRTHWIAKPLPDRNEIIRFAAELRMPQAIAALLLQRGLNTIQDVHAFFHPSLSNLHNPFLMKDMDKAVARIVQALGDGEKILVYGDYDVDGTTAVALVYGYLRQQGADCGYYIPDRYKEGYGISFAGIDYAAENGYSLIIALDCGIKANDKVDYAHQKNIDFIICDHHRPGDKIPNAVAVLDPKRDDCNYPYDELSGCGIGFKLIQALNMNSNGTLSEIIPWLDLVAVSIAADIVPVTGENRVLASFGLKQINTAPRTAFKALFAVAGLKKEIAISDLVFTAAPRINAAGRIDHGKGAVELLVENNPELASQLANDLNKTNTERRDLDKQTTIHALEMIDGDQRMRHRKSTVVFHPEWHKGVVGIVASRLIDRYYRPTIVLTQHDGKVTGSARSVREFDIYEAIEACSDLLIQFGGHKYAAGLTLSPENVESFIEKFDREVSARITEEQLIPVTEVDLDITLKSITPEFLDALKQFAPFGPGNMNPMFRTRNVADRGWARIVGDNHLKCDLFQPPDRNHFTAAIGFQLGGFLPEMQNGSMFSACYTVEENHWNGNVSVQLNLRDLKI